MILWYILNQYYGNGMNTSFSLVLSLASFEGIRTVHTGKCARMLVIVDVGNVKKVVV